MRLNRVLINSPQSLRRKTALNLNAKSKRHAASVAMTSKPPSLAQNNVKQWSLDFKPRNTTPLYDAMAKMIAHIERMSSDRADEDVTVVVFTDGGENASREFSSATVFGLVEQKKKLGWTFVFLGANQDSYKSGGAVGFSRGSTTNFQASAAGAKAAWGDITAAYSHRRARIASRSVAFRDASPAARAAQVAEAADFFRATPRAAEAQMASK